MFKNFISKSLNIQQALYLNLKEITYAITDIKGHREIYLLT
jgi:hypothetical protein